MIRKIHVNDLLVGMYVEKTDQSWLEHDLLFASKRKIKTDYDIDKFKSSEIEQVYINTEKGRDIPIDRSDAAYKNLLDRISFKPCNINEPEIKTGYDSEEYSNKLKEAKKIYSESLQFIKNFLNDARSGKIISYSEAIPFVNTIVETINNNKNATLSMVNLYTFDEYTYTHCLDVAIIALALGRHIGVPAKDLKFLGLGALFHDIGKSKIPNEIINKPGKLTEHEFSIIKSHPLEGYKLLENQKEIPQEVLRIIVEHHEKYNGQGYPLGLSGKDINQLANLVSVADIYDALTTDRAYRKGLHPYKALQVLFCEKDDDFYPGYAENLVKCLGIYPVGSLVKLSTGDYGRVIDTNDDHPLAPKIEVILDEHMKPRQKALLDLNTYGSVNKRIKIVQCLHPEMLPVDVRRHLMYA